MTTIFSKFVSLSIHRILLGFSTIPTGSDWLIGLSIIAVYAIVTLLFGIWTGFLKWHFQSSRLTIIRVVITSLFAPALLEELFFRVMVLPHPSENANFEQITIWSIFGLFLFVIYHPLNALTFFSAGRKTFFHPIFLTLAFLLGCACTATYLYTGSILISIAIHWIAVVVWLLFWGGIEKLSPYLNEY